MQRAKVFIADVRPVFFTIASKSIDHFDKFAIGGEGSSADADRSKNATGNVRPLMRRG